MSKNRLRLDWSPLLGFALAVGVSFPVAVPAAPGNLAQAPLFLSTGVSPNIFFVLDDSATMHSDVLKSAGAEIAHPRVAGLPPLFPRSWPLQPPPNLNVSRLDRILELCPGYNVLAYNPSFSYTPWSGVDSNGAAFSNRTLTTACDDPYYPVTCNKDIRSFFYFPWSDNINVGDYDTGECPTPNLVDWGNSIDAADCQNGAGCTVAADLPSTATPSDINTQTNFANWYSYYRKREYVVKWVVSGLISSSSDRMGLATVHNSGPDAGQPSTPVRDMGNASDKDRLLRNLLLMDSERRNPGGTPLRRALDQAGAYFDDTDGRHHEYLGSAETSPILDFEFGGHCQKNFAILLSDGYWNGNWHRPSGSNNTDTDGQVFPSHGDADSDGDSQWDGGSYADRTNATCGADAITANTLADIAMHYYETDLSDLRESVAPSEGDPNPKQHLVTFAVAFGVDGTVSDEQAPTDRNDAFRWPPVCPDHATAVDDMRHAAWNGRGKFLAPWNPKEVAVELAAAMGDITQRAPSTTSSVAFSSTRLVSDTMLFQSQVDPADWSGDLLAFAFVANENGVLEMSATPAWQAGDKLDNAMTPAGRIILTRGASDGVAFEWDNLTEAQQRDLCASDDDCTDAEEVLGQLRLGFLRGDRSCEDQGDHMGCATGLDNDADSTNDKLVLRKRGSRLGDIVGSGPLVVGAPALGWPSANSSFFPTAAGETYAAFKTANTARAKVVYVGANDGMLHGFRASDGVEVLAYVPSALAASEPGSGLHYLTEPAFQTAHRFYVDRTPAISDVYIPTTDGGSDRAWRTVAVGGLGAGGRGLYAMDITDPTDFIAANAADIVMWEFTSANDAELGYTVSQPIIAMMNNGKWAAIFGSGYNDTGSNEAHLFILFLEEGLDGTWDADEYIKIEATLGTDGSPLAERNGLSSPAVADLDGNGTADRVYAGDLLGNLWVFDVSSTGVETWGVAGSGASCEPCTPLFQAGTNQPITIKPEISKHPSKVDIADGTANDNQPNVMVYFGTGQLLTLADKTTDSVQAFYGVWDKGDAGLTQSDLQEQTFVSGYSNQVLTDEAVDWTSDHGWYFSLPDTGERVVVDATLRGGIVFFNSAVPAGDNPCDAGGTGFLYAVDIENGGPPDDPVYDFDSSGVVNEHDVATTDAGDERVPSRASFEAGIPTASTFMGNVQYTGSTEAGLQQRAVAEMQGLDTGRLSWQQFYRE